MREFAEVVSSGAEAVFVSQSSDGESGDHIIPGAAVVYSSEFGCIMLSRIVTVGFAAPHML